MAIVTLSCALDTACAVCTWELKLSLCLSPSMYTHTHAHARACAHPACVCSYISMHQYKPLQKVPYVGTFNLTNFPRCESVFARPVTEVSSCVGGTWSHACIPYSGCASVYFAIQYCIDYSIFISSPGCQEASIKAAVYSQLC